jgi:hypothetical protein
LDRFRPEQNGHFHQAIRLVGVLTSCRDCREYQKPEKHVNSNAKETSPDFHMRIHTENLLKTFWWIVASGQSIGYNSTSEGTSILFCLSFETTATGNGVAGCRSILGIADVFQLRALLSGGLRSGTVS